MNKVYSTLEAGKSAEMEEVTISTKSTQKTVIETALTYAANGFSVFPLKPGMKVPATMHGVKDATQNVAKIKTLFKEGMGIGIACGSPSFMTVVLDCDVHDGCDGVKNFWAEVKKHGGDVELVTARTPSGGMHVYFMSKYFPLMKNAVKQNGIEGCDIRTTGGYVVAPPTTISAGAYKFDDFKPSEVSALELPEMPHWLVELVLSAQYGSEPAAAALRAIDDDGADIDEVAEKMRNGSYGYAGGPLKSARQSIVVDNSGTGAPATAPQQQHAPAVGEGGRNAYLTSLAGSLVRNGITGQELFDMLVRVNETKCVPPLSPNEVRSIANSVTRYASPDAPQTVTDKTSTVMMTGGEQLETTASCLPQTAEINGVPELAVISTKKQVKVQSTVSNLVQILLNDSALKGKVVYDVFLQDTCVRGRLPWMKQKEFREWSNTDDAGLTVYMQRRYGMGDINAQKLGQAILQASQEQQCNPLAVYLTSIKWDGKKRAERLLIDCLGADNTAYTREATLLWLRGAWRRCINPGCKFDYMWILKGKQGLGKSWLLRKLAVRERYSNDNLNTIDGDKAFEKIRGCWIVELAELLATKKTREVEAIKAFITSQVDTYRTPYSRVADQHPRTCVFAGTTNAESFLADRTGNRRFLVIHCGNSAPTVNMFDEKFDKYIEQVWAEVIATDDGAPLVLSADGEKARDAINEMDTEDDDRIGIIQMWLEEKCKSDRVCARQLLEEALEYTPQMIEQKRSLYYQDMARIMSNMPGWSKSSKKQRVAGYGIQRCYERVEPRYGSGFSTDDESPF